MLVDESDVIDVPVPVDEAVKYVVSMGVLPSIFPGLREGAMAPQRNPISRIARKPKAISKPAV
ncbi:MAG: hypothetical protein MZV49_13510 [Rhodopseudomonas palustris]|nr:hypothetical protein [Rhodopseudomonas palustris]